jgi:acetyltransferase-like isoleucine patch superfamily enzyme
MDIKWLIHNLRMFMLQRKFKCFGKNSSILYPCMLTNSQYVEIGDNVFIREYARIEAVNFDGQRSFSPELKIGEGTAVEQFFHVGACELVDIGKNVLIAGRVYITDHNHRFSDIDKPILSQGIEPGGKVIIGDNAWLGEGCVILPGVTIGSHAIIGANAVVTQDIPPYTVAVGNPARAIKKYDAITKDWITIP